MTEVNKSENLENIILPDEFKDLYGDKSLKWFIMETVSQDTKLQKSVKFVFPTRMENGEYDMNDVIVGIPEGPLSVVYRRIISMIYEPDITTYGSSYFRIKVSDYETELILLALTEDNILEDVKTKKIVHLVHGMKGDRGEPGMSSYDIWYEKYPMASKDEFIDLINSSVNAGKFMKTQNDYEERLQYLEKQLNGYAKLLNQIQSNVSKELPIGALMYSLVRPPVGIWLRFGDGNTYYDIDYPELAEIVKSWNSDCIVSEREFQLLDASNLNRYLVAAGGSRPSGTIIEQQLPNIVGCIGPQNTDDGGISGCFYKGGYHGGGNGAGASNYIYFDASRSSGIYKNDANEVFGNAIAIDLWIKAKHAIAK